MKISNFFISISLISLFISGCVPVLVVTTAAVAGYSFGNGSAVGTIETEYRVLWDMCLDQLDVMKAESIWTDESKGIIKARVSDNNIKIKINTINEESQYLKVSARRNLMPKTYFAQEVFFKIAENL